MPSATPSFPLLPPAFQLVVLDRETDPFGRACCQAPRGLDDGTVYWCGRADRLGLAFALEPEVPRAAALGAVHVLTVAAGEALGLPAVAFAWPAGLVVDGAGVGRVRAAVGPTCAAAGAVPPWLVLGLDLRPPQAGEEPPVPADGPAGPAALMAQRVARSFLAWNRRWREEGFAPVRAAWNARCLGLGEPATVRVRGGGFRSGEVGGLDEAGGLRVGDAVVPLETALLEGLG